VIRGDELRPRQVDRDDDRESARRDVDPEYVEQIEQGQRQAAADEAPRRFLHPVEVELAPGGELRHVERDEPRHDTEHRVAEVRDEFRERFERHSAGR
jgi:hypothetical protein